MVALVVAMSSSVWAKMGGKYSCCQLIYSGEPVTISGIVVDIQHGNRYLRTLSFVIQGPMYRCGLRPNKIILGGATLPENK